MLGHSPALCICIYSQASVFAVQCGYIQCHDGVNVRGVCSVLVSTVCRLR